MFYRVKSVTWQDAPHRDAATPETGKAATESRSGLVADAPEETLPTCRQREAEHAASAKSAETVAVRFSSREEKCGTGKEAVFRATTRFQRRGRFGECGVFGGLTVLVFFSAFLLGGRSHRDEARVVVATVGGAAVLPCRLDSPEDASDLVVEWARPDLDPGFVHVWRDGKELLDHKQPSYEGRTSVSAASLALGDASLTISGVRRSDGGTYRCRLPSLGPDSFVELIVASGSQPTIEVVSDDDAELVLVCRGAGWSPEPELLWLDAEGNLLPAGPTETVRGADGLYTVSSTVTVEKRHGSTYTCRVQQSSISQATDAHITVADYFLGPPLCAALFPTVLVAFVLVIVCKRLR